eukprot:gene10406-5070_t
MDYEAALAWVQDKSNTKLNMYGLYKQINVGDVEGSQPWAVQVEARAKWDAWAKEKGKSADDCKTEYAALVNAMV